MKTVSEKSQAEKTCRWHCTHCRTEVPGQIYDRPQAETDTVFCCAGCRLVFDILSRSRLGQYYSIKNKSEFFFPAKPVKSAKNRFHYLEDPDAQKKYGCGPDGRSMNFYIEGVHCVACLWLMEHLPALVPGLERAEMEMGSMVLKITAGPEGSFAAAAEMLSTLGYEPHPIATDEEAEKLREKEDKKQLLQVGIAGFCAANIMFVFICIYAGISGRLWSVFRYFSFGLFLPVVLYSAQPFYKSALAAVRARQMNIDVPVALALILGTAAGIRNLFAGSEHIYFDSLSVFVFLLLGTRFFLKKLHQKFSGRTDLSEFLIPAHVLRVDPVTGALERTAPEKLKPGDLVQIAEEEVLAVDGEVAEGESYLDCHMLNGESLPVFVKRGASVYAGTVNQGPVFRVRVKASGRATRLAGILAKINDAEKPRVVEAADRVAKWYLWLIFAVTGAVMLWFSSSDFEEGFNRALAVIIVACPCALALATPLAYSMGLAQAGRQGVLLKGPSVLERLARVQAVFLDKTGTLTHGQFDVLDWSASEAGRNYYEIAGALERDSRHPIALAIRRYLEDRGVQLRGIRLTDFGETPGRGVEGYWNDHFYEIRSAGLQGASPAVSPAAVETVVGLFEDGICRVRIRLGDALRSTSKAVMGRLCGKYRHVELLSGDSGEAVQAAASQLGITEFQSGVSPEEKQKRVAEMPYALMAGDGANDALALSSAYVSAAVQGSLDVSLRCADMYFLKPGLEPLPAVLKTASQTHRTIRRNLLISLIYNGAGVCLALAGWVNPLVAAVVMPLSSFSVLVSSLWGIREGRD